MSTYVVKSSNINLNKNKKNNLAKGITRVHNKITGANSYFAQVIFEDTKKTVTLWEVRLLKINKYFYMEKYEVTEQI